MTSSRRVFNRALVAVTGCFVLGLAWSAVHAADPVPPAPKAKLVIKKAVYGDLPDGGKIDVTEKVAKMVKDDALSVEATNDNFTDPADGIVKKLKVDYTFDGKDKSKTVDENETLTISKTGE